MNTYNKLLNENKLLSVITLKDDIDKSFKLILPSFLTSKVIKYLNNTFNDVSVFNFFEIRLISNDKNMYFLTGDKLNKQNEFMKNETLKLKLENLFNKIINNKEFNDIDKFYLKNWYNLTISFIIFKNN